MQAGQRVFSVTGGSTFTPAAYGTIDIINVAANNKRGNFHTTTSDSGGELDDLVLGGFVWENTSAQISRINVILGDGFNVEFGTGSTVYVYGTDSKAKIAFDIKDNGAEIWRFITEDDFKGWKRVVCNFKKFLVRDDWQPENADKNSQPMGNLVIRSRFDGMTESMPII